MTLLKTGGNGQNDVGKRKNRSGRQRSSYEFCLFFPINLPCGRIERKDGIRNPVLEEKVKRMSSSDFDGGAGKWAEMRVQVSLCLFSFINHFSDGETLRRSACVT